MNADAVAGIRRKRGRQDDTGDPQAPRAQRPGPGAGEEDDDFAPQPKSKTKQPEESRAAAEEGEDEEEDDEEDDDDDDDDDEDFGGLAKDREDRKYLKSMPELEREMELERRAAAKSSEKLKQQLLGSSRDTPSSKAQTQMAEARRPRRGQAAATKKLDSLKDMKAAKERRAEFGDAEDGEQKDNNDAGASAAQEPAGADGEEEGMVDEPVTQGGGRRGAAGRGADGVLEDKAGLEDGEGGAGGDDSAMEDEEEEDEEDDDSQEREDDEDDDEMDEGDAGEDGEVVGRGEDDAEDRAEAGKEDVMRMQVLRSDLEDWLKHPNLDATLEGAVVRVALTKNIQGDAQYGMCVVHAVTQGKPYTFQGASAQVEADRYMVIIGVEQKSYDISFALVSNSPIRPEEYDAFHEDRTKAGVPQITKAEATSVLQKLDLARHYTLTADDVDRIVKEKKEKGLVRRSLAKQKAELTMLIKASQEKGDGRRAEQLQGELDGVLQRIRERDRDRETEMERLAELNRRAKEENRRRMQEASSKAQAGSGGRTAGLDPYSRKRTMGNVYWCTGKKSTATVQEAQATQERSEASKPQAKMHLLDELKAMQLPTCAPPLPPGMRCARRLLGPQYHFRRTRPLPREGKEVISLERYQEKLGGEKFRTLGLS